MSVNVHLQNIREISPENSTANDCFIDVIGNKEDAAANTADTASIIALLRYLIANSADNTDVLTVLGDIATAAHTGAPDATTTAMGYLKQLVTDLRTTKGDLDDGGRLDLLIDQILADTNELQIDWTNGGRLDLLIDAIKLVTDALPDAGALTSLAQGSDLILIDNKLGTFTNGIGDSNLGAIMGDFNNDSLAARLSRIEEYIDAEVATIKTKTDNLPDNGLLSSIAQASALALKLDANGVGTEFWVKKEVTSSDIKTAFLLSITDASTGGELALTDVILKTDSTGLATGTNIQLKTTNTHGATLIASEAVASLGANATSDTNSMLTFVKTIIETGKRVVMDCTGIDCTGAGIMYVYLKFQRLASGANIISFVP